MSQRLKDWLSGGSTPPSADPSHSAKDDLRHAKHDLVHAKDDLKADAKAKAHEMASDVRSGAAVVREKAHDAKEDVKGGLRYAKDVTVGAVAAGVEGVEHGIDRLAQAGHDVSEKLRHEAAVEKAKLHHEADKLRVKEQRAVQHAEARVREATSTMSFFQRRAPFYKDVGSSYGLSFNAPCPMDKRAVITTPDLMNDRRARWRITSVHNSNAVDSLSSSLSFTDNLFTPRADNGWYVPQTMWFKQFSSMPLAPDAKVTTSTGAEFAFTGRNLIGVNVRTVGNRWMASYKTRVPYVTLAGAVSQNPAKSNDLTMSMGSASTIFSDSARDSAVHVGVQAKSAQFALGSFPSALNSVTAKIEYDEPAWNVDAKVSVRQYKDAAQADTMRVSDALIRGLYCSNLGQYPRTAFGVTVGLMEGGEGKSTSLSPRTPSPDELRPDDPEWRPLSSWERLKRHQPASLAADTVVAAMDIAHHLDPSSKVTLSLSSLKTISASFTHNLSQTVALRTLALTTLPDWNPMQGGFGKPQLGLQITVNAE